MRKPIIGVLYHTINRIIDEVVTPITYSNTSYCKAIEKNGAIPMIIPYLSDKEDANALVDLCDGIMFPGGADVDPHLYNEEPNKLMGKFDRKMDEFWIYVEKLASQKQLPVLGICRGMQLINVAHGGSLFQDLSQINTSYILHRQDQNKSDLIHTVKIDKDSKIYSILGTNEIMTNSLHHQCVKNEADDLEITAYSVDGIPEAMEDKTGRIILVQWHPEELLETEPRMNNLFRNFIDRCQEKEEN